MNETKRDVWGVQLTLGGVLLPNIEHGIVEGSAHQKLETEVVNALGIAIRLLLLSLVPVENEAITESQACGGVGGVLVAIEHASREGSFNMAHNFLLEALFAGESNGLGLLPGFALRFGDGRWSRWLAS
jgi:hypothetical protein